MKAACQLYQLRSRSQLPIGAYVAINGPHDQWGYVIRSNESEGSFLNLIRGCVARPGVTPAAHF